MTKLTPQQNSNSASYNFTAEVYTLTYFSREREIRMLYIDALSAP